MNPFRQSVPLSRKDLLLGALLVACLVVSALSTAGTTGVEFQALHTLLQGWAEGYLGRALAIAAFRLRAGDGLPGAGRPRVRDHLRHRPGHHQRPDQRRHLAPRAPP